MTEKELELKRWLNRAFYADKKARALERLVQRCRERAQSISVCMAGNDKGKSDSSKNGTEDVLMRLLEMEERYTEQVGKLLDIQDEVGAAIALLNDIDLEAVLMNRYLNFMTISETAEDMHYSERAVKEKQKKAIEKLCPLLPCFALSDVI